MGDALLPIVVDAVPVAVIAVDLDDRVLVWNTAAERLFGWAAGDVIGAPIPIVPAGAEERRRRWLQAVAGGEEVEVTTEQVRKDGTVLDVTTQYAPLLDGGVLTGYVAVCRDASTHLLTVSRLQRSQAELALIRRLASLAQRVLQDLDLPNVLRAIAEVGMDLADCEAATIVLEDRPGHFVRFANVNIPDDLTGQPVVLGEGVHGVVLATEESLLVDDYDVWPHAAAAFRGRGFRAALAVPIRRPDRVIGSLALHSTSPGRRFGQTELGVVTLLAEYAAIAIANARAYRDVLAGREKFNAVVEAMHDGLVVVEGGVVTAWNPAAAALVGVAAGDAIGKPPPLDLDAAAAGIEVDGRWIETVSSALPHGAGTVYLVRDMTDQHALDQAKDLFFATTSHELKTPLTVVKGLASTLREHWERMPARQRDEALATIERRAESLNRLIERILVGSRVQAGAYAPVPAPTELRPLVEEAVRGFHMASVRHHVVADVPANLPHVAGDRQAIDTILGHLVENAVKYSPDGGDVVVAARLGDGGDAVVVTVLDEGVGIGDDFDRLTDPFVQADNRTTRRFGGVGLGLYIVSQLVAALGGELWAERRPDRGSAISFSLPVWR